jgi:hypothetical protein
MSIVSNAFSPQATGPVVSEAPDTDSAGAIDTDGTGTTDTDGTGTTDTDGTGTTDTDGTGTTDTDGTGTTDTDGTGTTDIVYVGTVKSETKAHMSIEMIFRTIVWCFSTDMLMTLLRRVCEGSTLETDGETMQSYNPRNKLFTPTLASIFYTINAHEKKNTTRPTRWWGKKDTFERKCLHYRHMSCELCGSGAYSPCDELKQVIQLFTTSDILYSGISRTERHRQRIQLWITEIKKTHTHPSTLLHVLPAARTISPDDFQNLLEVLNATLEQFLNVWDIRHRDINMSLMRRKH